MVLIFLFGEGEIWCVVVVLDLDVDVVLFYGVMDFKV